MKQKKTKSGSVKIDPIIYKKLSDFSKEKGIKISHYVTFLVAKDLELQKEKV